MDEMLRRGHEWADATREVVWDEPAVSEEDFKAAMDSFAAQYPVFDVRELAEAIESRFGIRVAVREDEESGARRRYEVRTGKHFGRGVNAVPEGGRLPST